MYLKETQLLLSGIEAHSSLGAGKCYYERFRRIFRNIRFTSPTVKPQDLLIISVKATNDTVGEKGLLPSRLILGIIPRFLILSTNLSELKERMEALKMAQLKMNTVAARRRVFVALLRNLLPAGNCSYKVGKDVLVYSELEKKRIGSLTVGGVKERIVKI